MSVPYLGFDLAYECKKYTFDVCINDALFVIIIEFTPLLGNSNVFWMSEGVGAIVKAWLLCY